MTYDVSEQMLAFFLHPFDRLQIVFWIFSVLLIDIVIDGERNRINVVV